MTKDYLQLLLDYHYWARDRVLAAVASLSPEQYGRPLGSSFSSVRETLNHIYQAEWIWYRRWQGESPSGFPEVGLPDCGALQAVWREHEVNVRAFVDNLGDAAIGRVIEYKLISGKPGASPFWQMLVHVVNHATYHRGQVGTLLRQLGAPPAQSTDMIAYFRERAA